jgi:hypothetical protein
VLPAEQARPDIAFKRARWLAHQSKIDPRRLVFIDETWVKTNMAPLRGWGLRGQRLDARVPHGHWKTLTFVAALRHDRVDAPCVIDGPINGDLFTAYVEQVLAPTLRPGEIVILDNLSVHNSAKAADVVRERGAWFLPLPWQPALHGTAISIWLESRVDARRERRRLHTMIGTLGEPLHVA